MASPDRASSANSRFKRIARRADKIDASLSAIVDLAAALINSR
jgi:hypothetical protein